MADSPLHPFEQKIACYIDSHGLMPSRDSRLIVAVSGGADSVALLAALTALGYVCTAAHCNFHLRGAESDRDTRHVATICEKLCVDLTVKHFDVDARRRQTGESLEMACRELRYGWFASLADSLQCSSVAVAHHRDDNIETMLLNLMRGTGLSGLTGMSPRRGLIVRPMLECTRAEAEAYLADRGLGFVTDSSNASNDFLRNRLRNIVIPAMEQQFPNARRSIARSIECLRQSENFYRDAIEAKRRQYMPEGKGTILLGKLRAQETHARLLLFEWLHPLGFSATQTDAIASCPRSGSVFRAGDISLTVSRDTAEITRESKKTEAETADVDISRNILTPVFVSVSRHAIAEFKPERDGCVLCLDTRVLEGNPHFELRHWRPGDSMEPFGMHGRRKLSDIFSDAKLSVNDKERLWLLTRDGKILWILGMRTSRHYSLGPETTHYLRLQWHRQ